MDNKIGTLFENIVYDGEAGPYVMLEGQPIYLDKNQIRAMTPTKTAVNQRRIPNPMLYKDSGVSIKAPLAKSNPNAYDQLITMEEGNLPIIDTSNPNVGFGEKGNIFPGGPFERKALMKMYGGTGSENAKRALAEDNRLAKEPASKGKIGPASQLARGQAEFNIAKRQRLNKQMNMQDPSDYYNPPQKQVSLGQLLGK